MAKLAQKLRESVLQAAIEGKLTERKTGDKSVDSIVDEINYDRLNRIKFGEIKKDKRLLEFKKIEDIPFDIPNEWKWMYLGQLLYKLTDGTHKTPKYTNMGVKFVSVKDLSSGKLSLKNTKYISENEHKELFLRCNPEKNDLLLTKVGTTGVPAIVDTDEQFSLFVSVALLKFNHKCINLKYFYYLLLSPLVQQQAADNTKGVGNKNWVLDKIAKTKVVLPPIEEQQRIVERVEELMAKIDEFEVVENKLEVLKKAFPEEMKNALLQAAMKGKLTEQLESDSLVENVKEIQSSEIPFEIPKNWKWTTLENISNINGGFAFKSSQYTNAGTRVIRISDFNEAGFTNKNIVRYPYNDELKQYIIEEKNILLCMTGGTVGKSLFVDKVPEKMVSNQRVATIKINGALPEYVYKVILSPFIQKMIDDSKNSTNDNISMSLIKNFPIPIPPIEEQERIVAHLEKLVVQF